MNETEYYDSQSGLTYALSKPKEEKSQVKRNKSADRISKYNQEEVKLEKTHSQQIEKGPSIYDNNQVSSKKIIRKNAPNNTFMQYQNVHTTNNTPIDYSNQQYNNSNNNIDQSQTNSGNNLTNNLTSDYSSSNNSSYVPKRVITKDKVFISSSFKTHPQEAIITSSVQVIDNEKKALNNAEYKDTRLFNNEKLNRGQVYLYSYGSNKETLQKLTQNKNLIIKGNQI